MKAQNRNEGTESAEPSLYIIINYNITCYSVYNSVIFCTVLIMVTGIEKILNYNNVCAPLLTDSSNQNCIITI